MKQYKGHIITADTHCALSLDIWSAQMRRRCVAILWYRLECFLQSSADAGVDRPGETLGIELQWVYEKYVCAT